MSTATRTQSSPLWGAFRTGMTAAELAMASGGRVSRATAGRFLEAAVERGELRRKKTTGRGRGTVRYHYIDEPQAVAVPAIAPMVPLRCAFAGRPVIPVREGGRVAPAMRAGFVMEVVGR